MNQQHHFDKMLAATVVLVLVISGLVAQSVIYQYHHNKVVAELRAAQGSSSDKFALLKTAYTYRADLASLNNKPILNLSLSASKADVLDEYCNDFLYVMANPAEAAQYFNQTIGTNWGEQNMYFLAWQWFRAYGCAL